MGSKSKRNDLTQGGILYKLLLIALPIMGTQLLQMAYNLTDMFWLGRVGKDVVAASGTAGMYLWLSNGFMFIGKTGAEIGVSQQMGAGKPKEARRFSENALVLSVVLGVMFAIAAMLFTDQMIGFFKIKETHVAQYAAEYLFITAIGIPATFISATVAGTFNASGNSIVPFGINIVGLATNMVLDPLLIFKYNMGIKGAAIATILAQILVAAMSILALKLRRIRPMEGYRLFVKPDKKVIKQIFIWSAPVAAENMLFTFLSMFISRFVAAFGADAIAVQRVGSQVESMSWLVSGGFATAITAFVGQNYGSGKWSRIRKGFKISLVTIVGWGVIVSCILFFAGRSLFSIFLPDPDLVEMGAYYLRVLTICQVFCSLEAAGAGAFRGLGKTLPPSVASITTNVGRVFLTYFLSQAFGINGIWWEITIGATLRGLWIFTWFMKFLKNQPHDDVKPKEGFEEPIIFA